MKLQDQVNEFFSSLTNPDLSIFVKSATSKAYLRHNLRSLLVSLKFSVYNGRKNASSTDVGIYLRFSTQIAKTCRNLQT